jgi:hypothetical protein
MGVATMAPYTGPRPSPARGLAPWVLAASAAIALSNVAQCALNLLERSYQQRRLTTNPPSAAQVRAAINTVKALGTITTLVALVWFVLVIVWASHRRPRQRLRHAGESAVEPSLRTVDPAAWWTLWVALALGVLMTAVARSAVHPGMSADDFARYRGYLALGNIARAGSWTCWVVLVARATAQQSRREAAAMPVAPGPIFAEPWAAPRV